MLLQKEVHCSPLQRKRFLFVTLRRHFTTALMHDVLLFVFSISEIKTVSPLGMIKSAVYQESTSDWRMNITWSAVNGNDVLNVFCFSAKESSG